MSRFFSMLGDAGASPDRGRVRCRSALMAYRHLTAFPPPMKTHEGIAGGRAKATSPHCPVRAVGASITTLTFKGRSSDLVVNLPFRPVMRTLTKPGNGALRRTTTRVIPCTPSEFAYAAVPRPSTVHPVLVDGLNAPPGMTTSTTRSPLAVPNVRRDRSSQLDQKLRRTARTRRRMFLLPVPVPPPAFPKYSLQALVGWSTSDVADQ